MTELHDGTPITPPLDGAFDYSLIRPVALSAVKLLVDRDTGEVIGWEGLNDDPERCPVENCGNCPTHCRCAPCRCSDCEGREAFSRRPPPEPAPRLVLV